MNKNEPGNPDPNKTGTNSIQPNEHGSYIDNKYERSVVWVAKGGEPRNEFEIAIKEEFDSLPRFGVVIDIPSDI